jgi:hypothetical protein
MTIRRDLDILENIYAISVLLGYDGPEGWGIKYAWEFEMTNDSKLFPPRPKWEAEGYRPDEYSRWLKGDWRPIAELWAELGIDPLQVVSIDPSCEDRIDGPDVQRTDWRVRCAQPPYDTLPVPRAHIPPGIMLSREADAWIREDSIEDIALPLYEGRMIGQFDFSQKGWVSGKGRGAVWEDLSSFPRHIYPQYLMSFQDFMARVAAQVSHEGATSNGNVVGGRYEARVSLIDVTSSTNARTTFTAVVPAMPHGHSAPVLMCDCPTTLSGVMNSFVFDWTTRLKQSGLHLVWAVLEELPLYPRSLRIPARTDAGGMALSFVSPVLSPEWLRFGGGSNSAVHPSALTYHERSRLRDMLDAVVAVMFGIDSEDFAWILRSCDLPVQALRDRGNAIPLDAKGFWRVDKDKDPELRHTVLTLVAFHDLEQKIRECGGDREKGIEAFLNQNNGEGWMLPETLRLADYGLGHDERAKEHQPVASRLGPRFYDWQLAQTPEESWRECHLHARNLLGEGGYLNLLGEVLRDTAEGGWREALTLAYELSKKENLLQVFEVALGSLPPPSWPSRLVKAGAIMVERGFAFERDDLVQLTFGVLKRVPEGERAEGLRVSRDLLGEDGLRTVISRLLATELYNLDGPWHLLVRGHLGKVEYGALIADLEAKAPGVAESAAPYEGYKMTQRRLF